MNGRNLLRMLSSLKLTVALLFCVVIICLIGTAFPQDGVSALAHSHVPGIASLLSPYDIFHSIWFIAAGILLCVNLVLCMRGRLNLKRKNLLMLLLHVGIILVVIGYSMGSLSLEGFIEIPEGTAVSQAMLKKGSAYDLGFSVRCDRFTIERYTNGMPKEYISDLSFLKDGAVAGQARLMVNHPARFEGISFYQESFRDTFSASVTVADSKGVKTYRMLQGEVIPLSPDGTRAEVVKVWDDLMRTGPAVKLKISGPSGEQYLWVFRDLKLLKERMPGILEQMPGFDPSGLRPYTFSLESLDASPATGIGVKRDPGAPVAAVGGVLFLLSLLLLLAVPRVNAGREKGREKIPIAQRKPSGKRTEGCREGTV
ncbi:MAG TPA: cytochrome c biogenesis protein ResB [Desulfomonilia bacterium]|nr:cytochrome c biogenesis protein ResB [Desulfomonilia bacterium]HRV36899.1 cytochrome c biogenesis protein ResB [Desulfomonilia bacterium]